jgi:2-dehydro-3-deoxyphosphogluconate aldolase / (4S)-4-hydroxy-2-oxoglutarate aldolase
MFKHQLFETTPIVGILRNYAPQAVEKILSLYHEAGLNTIEITMNTEGATEMIRSAVSKFGDVLNIGAGTVVTDEDLEKAVNAGATFIVTPVMEEEVIKKAVALKVPIFPGAFTPTEINKAWRAGGSMIKVFPATFFGPDYFKEIKAPLNKIKLMATGGVTLSNLPEFFQKGADAVAMGSHLFPKNLIEEEKWGELRDLFIEIKKIYDNYKSLSRK